jgi:hypothetical protein
MSYKPKNFTASATLSASDADTICTVNAAAGLTLTLPDATGSGVRYEVFIGTTVTSNNVIIQVANASDTMAGLVMSAADGGDTLNGWETASTSDTITLDGTTKGGVKGDRYVLVDCADNLWSVNGWSSSTGTEATPFSAAV